MHYHGLGRSSGSEEEYFEVEWDRAAYWLQCCPTEVVDRCRIIVFASFELLFLFFAVVIARCHSSIASGLKTWGTLTSPTHLALVAHICSPGSWLACFTQTAN
jgi:hypothetical protein